MGLTVLTPSLYTDMTYLIRYTLIPVRRGWVKVLILTVYSPPTRPLPHDMNGNENGLFGNEKAIY